MDEWILAAMKVREQAYAPYSNFKVGAALVATDGRIFTGCNVENISFGLTMCAERVALGKAVAEGVREFAAIAIVADTTQPVSPCGACRQVLAEFRPDLPIILSTLRGVKEEMSLADLLPRAATGILDRP
ncbi:MAG TPA: cytidine deaminase [Chthoniobacterales bacterium]|nr:cytidine deaminase [Chthoniobacterales bacterium]